MVFSDTGDLHGGFMDTNAGVDYHVPVRGARTGPPPLRVVHVSVEMAPIAKVLCQVRLRMRMDDRARLGPASPLIRGRVAHLS